MDSIRRILDVVPGDGNLTFLPKHVEQQHIVESFSDEATFFTRIVLCEQVLSREGRHI